MWCRYLFALTVALLCLFATATAPIEHYIDKEGIIHITNSKKEQYGGNEKINLRGADDYLAPGDENEKGSDLSPKMTIVPLTSPSAEPEAGKRVGSLSQPICPSAGTVKKYYDNSGIIHITNFSSGELTTSSSLASYRLPIAEAAGAEESSPIAPPTAQPGKTGSQPKGLEKRREFLQVKVSRDRQGRIRITNLPPPIPRKARIPPTFEESPETLKPVVRQAADRYHLPAPLVEALIKVESNFVPQAVSPKGAVGLMQLMPGTASFLGVQDPFDPKENVMAGCRYFRLLLDLFGQSLPLALAAYNAGYQRVIDAGFRIPAIPETQAFVFQVLGRYFLAKKFGNQRKEVIQ